eukprot:1183946-Prorocentrum_minimum.AAC.1
MAQQRSPAIHHGEGSSMPLSLVSKYMLQPTRCLFEAVGDNKQSTKLIFRGGKRDLNDVMHAQASRDCIRHIFRCEACRLRASSSSGVRSNYDADQVSHGGVPKNPTALYHSDLSLTCVSLHPVSQPESPRQDAAAGVCKSAFT